MICMNYKSKNSRGVMFGSIIIENQFIVELSNMVVMFSNLEKELHSLCPSQIKSKGKYFIDYIITSKYSFKQLINVTRSLKV